MSDDHSSSPAIAGGIKRPTRRLGRAIQPAVFCWAPPYLVLLRAGFCLPPVLPRARCALTAPFHPYPSHVLRRASGRYFFCATVLQVALTGRYPAHCPAEFGLSSRLRLRLRRGRLPKKPVPPSREARRRTAVWLTATRRLYRLAMAISHLYPSLSCDIWYCSSFL